MQQNYVDYNNSVVCSSLNLNSIQKIIKIQEIKEVFRILSISTYQRTNAKLRSLLRGEQMFFHLCS